MTTQIVARIHIQATDPDEHREQELQYAELVEKAREIALARAVKKIVVAVDYPLGRIPGNYDLLEIDFSEIHIRTLPPDDVVEEE